MQHHLCYDRNESSTSNMVLPLDVCYHIAEMLEDDPSTLRHIALTSHALLSCARSSLYKSINVSSNAFCRVDLLSRTLRADPQLGALVKSLKLSGLLRDDPFDTRALQTPSEPFTSDLLPFYLLLNLHTLNMESVTLTRGIDDLIAIMGSLPSLKRLICYQLAQCDSQGPMRPRPPPSSASLAPPQSLRFPILRELVITYGRWSHWEFATQLLQNYLDSVGRLESIVISMRAAVDALMWVPVIRAAGRWLRMASMSIADTSMRSYSGNLPAEIGSYRESNLQRAVCTSTAALCVFLTMQS